KLLAVDDVLIDSMRGRSSTWTRVRVNLRHVPEKLRPPQETPDPDDDPTREWRASPSRRGRRDHARGGGRLLPIFRLSPPRLRRAPSPSGRGIPKNGCQFEWRNDFELRICAVARLLVRTPPAKLCQVAESGTLHVFVSDFDDQFGPQRLPGKILALAPAALAAGYATPGFVVCRVVLGPCLPGVASERILSIWGEVLDEVTAHAVLKAPADSDMLQGARIVVKAKQQGADSRALTVFVPSKAANDTIAIALVLHLQHDALVGLILSRNRLGHEPVETSALKAAEPIRRDAQVGGCWSQMDRRCCG